MAAETDSATAPEVSIFDLEEPICRARNSAKLVEITLNKILDSKHPLAVSDADIFSLLIDEEEASAALHSVSELRDALRTLTGLWMAALKQQA